MGVGFIAEQAGALGSEAHHFGGDRAVVGRAAVFAARLPGAKGGLPQIAAGRELQERLDARPRQSDREVLGMAALGGDSRRAGAIEIRQALEILLVKQHEPRLFVGEHVLPELGGERREPLADRSQTRLGVRRRARAGAGEIEVIAAEHARLFGRKPELGLFRLQGVDALEQRLVQIGVVAMAGENRRDLALDRLQFFVGRRTREIEEDAGDTIEAAAAALERLDRIGEGGRGRVGGDGVDFAPRLFQRGGEGGAEVGGLDALERRRLERPGPRFEKRVCVGRRAGH